MEILMTLDNDRKQCISFLDEPRIVNLKFNERSHSDGTISVH